MKFFLFTVDLILAKRAENAGIYSLVVDWETKGKIERQDGFDLEINFHNAEDVLKLSSAVAIPITVRINPMGSETPMEVEKALTHGAQIIMLPMANSTSQVADFLTIVNKRAKTIVQIETPEIAEQTEELATMAWDYAYIGLNDLMVARGRHSIWEALIDGTTENICSHLKGREYGFGGSTVLSGGEPIINLLIIHELVRLGGSISIMRRTFKRELLDRDLDYEIMTLLAFIECSKSRGEQAKKHDHEHLFRIINKMIDF